MDVVKTLDIIDLQGMDIMDEQDQETILSSVTNLKSGGDGTAQEAKNESPDSSDIENASKKAKRVSYGPMEVNAKAFNEVLEHYQCSPSKSGNFTASFQQSL